MDLLVRILGTLAVLLGGTAFILFILICVLRDLLIRHGAFEIDATDLEAAEGERNQSLLEEPPSAEPPSASGALF